MLSARNSCADALRQSSSCWDPAGFASGSSFSSELTPLQGRQYLAADEVWGDLHWRGRRALTAEEHIRRGLRIILKSLFQLISVCVQTLRQRQELVLQHPPASTVPVQDPPRAQKQLWQGRAKTTSVPAPCCELSAATSEPSRVFSTQSYE